MRYDMTLTIGHNCEERDQLNREMILAAFETIVNPEGYTTFEAWGKWNDECENSTVIKICGLDQETVSKYEERLIPLLGAKLNQACIMCETIVSASKLIWRASDEEFANYAKSA